MPQLERLARSLGSVRHFQNLPAPDLERQVAYRVHDAIGEPIEVAPRLDVTQLNLLRASLERRLLSMHAELDARTGFRDSEPLRAPAAANEPVIQPATA